MFFFFWRSLYNEENEKEALDVKAACAVMLPQTVSLCFMSLFYVYDCNVWMAWEKKRFKVWVIY